MYTVTSFFLDSRKRYVYGNTVVKIKHIESGRWKLDKNHKKGKKITTKYEIVLCFSWVKCINPCFERLRQCKDFLDVYNECVIEAWKMPTIKLDWYNKLESIFTILIQYYLWITELCPSVVFKLYSNTFCSLLYLYSVWYKVLQKQHRYAY